MIRDSLRSEGLTGFEKIKFIDIPRCIMRGAESSQCLDASLIPPFLGRGSNKLSPKKGSARAKRPQCRSCIYNSECAGVSLNYIKVFGWSEFIPETRSKKVLTHAPGLGDRYQLVIEPAGWNKNQWRNFFCHEDFRREIATSMYLSGTDKIFRIEHGETECQFSRFEDDGQTISFFNYPWLTLPFRGPLRRPFLPTCEITDIKDNDVILGTQKKLQSLIDSIIAESKNSKIVSLTSLCLPTVIGDDMDAVLKRCEEKARCPVIYINTRIKKDQLVFDEIFKIITNSSAFLKVARKTNSVNLVDFSVRYRKEELLPFLKELGVEVNVCILPEIDISKLQQYMAAGIQVFFSGSPRGATVQRYLLKLPMETLIVPAPYGFEGARECARVIASAFGKEKKFQRIWEKKELSLSSKWKDLRLQASKYSLALVVDERALPLLDAPAYWGGFSLLRVLDEMGFRIEILAYAPSDSVRRRIIDFTEKLGLDSRIEINTFDNNKRLQELLKAGKFRAVYSDIYHDWRITEAGKSQFSLRYFEMGLGGAVVSLENLLGVCRLPFYRRYGKYLANIPRSRDV